MNSQELAKIDLPDCPGVYYFLGPKKEILYIGKATSLKDRVRSYFGPDLIHTRGPLLVKMLDEAVSVTHTTTDSVLEALLLEVHLIKKLQPFYNRREKDDRSYNFITITDEDFPKIVITRGSGTYGPFPHAGELRAALKIIRRILPYRDEKCKLTGKPCFNAQIGLCPGPCAGWIGKREYRKQVKRIRLFFEGKKNELVLDIEKEMRKAAKEQRFEEAERLKRTLYSLEHIEDMALIKRDIERQHGAGTVRIEAYDIAHLSGREAVGVMVVVEDGELNKSQYRKFKIRVDKNDDVGNLKEVIVRRLNHPEWDMPKVVVIDGGKGQLNAAEELLKGRDIHVVAVVKDEKHKARDVLGNPEIVAIWRKSILLANADAHRFAVGYHRKLRSKGFRI